jgi:site-specific DNA-methyltransferase (adenine-specific)
MNDLFSRCAALGWTLKTEGAGYLLLGNGADAVFRDGTSLHEWLVRREREQKTMQPYYQDDKGITLYHGDCLDVMPRLDACLFDAIICDPPYGTTACAWDSTIPFDAMWGCLKRLTKRRAAIVLFGSEPFSSALRASNFEQYRYDWIWRKTKPTNFLQVSNQPLKEHENISVFGGTRYFPQDLIPVHVKSGRKNKAARGVYNSVAGQDYIQEVGNFPRSILEFAIDPVSPHSAAKPLLLMEYLIKTYTNPGDMILDFTCGSGTTLRAAKNLGRRCVGIERDLHYCEVTVKRLEPEFEAALVDNNSDLSDLPLFSM